MPATVTDRSCIASSRADWVLGVARLISSASTQVGEDRPALELEPAAALGRLEHDVGADQVGRHQVGRELDALELQVQGVGQRPHQQRLAQPRHALRAARGRRRSGPSACRRRSRESPTITLPTSRRSGSKSARNRSSCLA